MTTVTGSPGSLMGFGGPFGSTRRVLREEVGRALGMHEGVADTNAVTTAVVDATLVRFGNDYWIGCECYIQSTQGGDTATAPAGQSGWVTDFVSATGVLTVSPAYTVAPTTDATYQLYKWVSTEKINHALQEAARGAEIATSLTVETDSFDYDLAGAVGLSRRAQVVGVYWRDQADLETMPVRLPFWEVEEAEGRLYLRVPATFTTGDQLWVTYRADEHYLTADTLCINLPQELVVARAVVYLLQRLLSEQDAGGAERIGQLLRYWEDQKKTQEAQHQRPALGVKQHDWGARLRSAENRSDSLLGIESLYTG